jgi:hypothetical protein
VPPSYSVIVLYAIALHLTWAVAIFFDENVRQVTAIHELSTYAPYPWTEFILGAVAILALAGLFIKSRLWSVLLMLPQQMILFLSAFGGIEAMYMASFPDGVVRTHAFLIADQMPVILAAVGHTIAILNSAQGENVWNGRSRSRRW